MRPDDPLSPTQRKILAALRQGLQVIVTGSAYLAPYCPPGAPVGLLAGSKLHPSTFRSLAARGLVAKGRTAGIAGRWHVTLTPAGHAWQVPPARRRPVTPAAALASAALETAP